jgi:hypothetical protein
MPQRKIPLRQIVSEFRKGILGKRNSAAMCYAVCAPLQSYLGLIGYETELVEGDFGTTNHYWLELPDGTIIDPTADQFSTPMRKMPKIYIGPLPDWYKPYEDAIH